MTADPCSEIQLKDGRREMGKVQTEVAKRWREWFVAAESEKMEAKSKQ
jgi:hypothetical protein